MSYFRELPSVDYQSPLQTRISSLEYVRVKNIFRRVKLRDDLQNVFTLFNKYEIGEGERPDTVAENLYGSADLDWVVMITAGIINVRNDWPLSDKDIYYFTEDKYGAQRVNDIKFYESTEVKDSKGRLIFPKGKIVDENFTISYYESGESTVSANEYYAGPTTFISTTYNNLPVRGYLYYPTTPNVGSNLDVIVLYHGTILSPGVTPFQSANTFIQIVRDNLKIKDKIIFSVAYPQDYIPAWQSNPSLPALQFPGIDYPNFYFGDNIYHAEAALLWVKENLNSYFSSIGVGKSISKVYTFGHSQGAYLVHRLNTMHPVDGVISNAPGPIDLLTRCSGEQQTDNPTCNKIRVGFGLTSVNPEAYVSRSLKSYLSGTLSKTLFTQALDDTTGGTLVPQVANMQNIVQVGLSTCTNCQPVEFKYYNSGGHDAFVSNKILQQDIRDFVESSLGSVSTSLGQLVTVNPVVGISNYEYEVRKNNEKRSIYILKPEYLQQYLNDMREIMYYDKSSQYINERLIKTENTRNTSP